MELEERVEWWLGEKEFRGECDFWVKYLQGRGNYVGLIIFVKWPCLVDSSFYNFYD